MRQIVPNLWEFDEIGTYNHCYMWKWAEGITLIDTGLPTDADKILTALTKNGYPLHSVKRIIITHMDLDHAGGLQKIHQATQAAVACHAVEKEFMEYPVRRQPAWWVIRPLYWLLTLMPAYQLRPITPNELLVDGETLPEGFTVVHTPGHTPGHISLLHKERRLLITGDALSNRGGKLRSPQPIYTPDEFNAQRSVWKLAKRYGDDYETIVFGHGPPILQNGGKRVKALASQIFSTQI
ncbi:MAG: MBL fold metallo-hydrolase [Chloroflexota bacterium]